MLFLALMAFFASGLALVFLSLVGKGELLVGRAQAVGYPMLALGYAGRCTDLNKEFVAGLSVMYIVWCAIVVKRASSGYSQGRTTSMND